MSHTPRCSHIKKPIFFTEYGEFTLKEKEKCDCNDFLKEANVEKSTEVGNYDALKEYRI